MSPNLQTMDMVHGDSRKQENADFAKVLQNFNLEVLQCLKINVYIVRETSLTKPLKSDLFLRLLFSCLFIFMDTGFWHTEFAYIVSEKMEKQQQLPLGHALRYSDFKAHRIRVSLVSW